MAGNQITAALSDMSLSELPAKVPNFPLPREFRDKIYGYLLDGDYTRLRRPVNAGRDGTSDDFHHQVQEEHAYYFHTNILVLNRAIHEEAEELLYKRNIFVVVSYQWPGIFNRTSGWFWVPTVSKKHVARMKRHSLRIHASPGTSALADVAQQTGKDVPMESFIVLAKDIQALCFTLALPAACTRGPAIQIRTGSGGEPCIGAELEHFIDRKERSMHLRLELRDTTYRTMSAELQRNLLTPLANVVAPSQRVIFTGSICDTLQTESLKRSMGPTLFCWTAFIWTHFQKLMTAKHTADAALESQHDNPAFVLFQYLTLELLSSGEIEKEIVRHELLSNHPTLYEAMHIFHFELLITIACVKLKTRNSKSFDLSVKTAIDFFAKMSQEPAFSHILPEGLQPYYDSIRFWSYLYRGKDATRKAPVEFHVRKLRRTVSQHGPHQAHDLSFLESLPDQKAILTRQLFPFSKSSIWQLPFPCTSFYKSMPGLEQREDFRKMA